MHASSEVERETEGAGDFSGSLLACMADFLCLKIHMQKVLLLITDHITTNVSSSLFIL